MAIQHSGEREWVEMFALLTRHVSNLRLCKEVEKLLRKKKIADAERFTEVAAGGFACTCSSSVRPTVPQNYPIASKGDARPDNVSIGSVYTE